MPLNCRLNRNISFTQPGDGGSDGCNGQSIAEGVGGIAKVVVYNISDVPSLTFENDARADESLVVDTINSTGQFYTVDFTSASYQEDYDVNDKWHHTLTLDIANISTLFEDILSDGVHGKYLVCFKPNGSEDWRMFGWKWGATLDYSLNISEDSLGYTVTLEDVSEYPLFAVDKENFGSKTKTYSPIFKPLYDVYFCEQDGSGRHTGYIIAIYVVKVNAAGQPLDRNNRLCQWSGLKQDAYKYSGISSDGGYNIIGTYTKTGSFDGKPVKVYDLEKCPANVTNSIYINSKKAETISLNSTISAGTYTITSTDDWMMVSDPQYVTISPVEGENGSTQGRVSHNGVGGCEQIKYMNKVTREVVTLDVCVNLITVDDSITMDCRGGEYVITPTVEGCSSAYTYSISPSIPNSKDEYGYIHITPTTSTTGTFTLTLTHSCDSNERKVVPISVICNSKDPDYQLLVSYCEIRDGEYTRYRIKTLIDTNPNSDTFGTTTNSRESDPSCSEGSPIWTNIGSFCEVVGGVNTGYYVTQEQDTNTESPTYGQTRETKAYNISQCPLGDSNPRWILDEKFEPYCEHKIYEPSGVEGNTGRLIVQLIDDNVHSSTHNQTYESGVTENEWDSTLQQMYGDFPCEAPDTTPQIEELTYSCELSANTEDFLVMTGYKLVTGMDKNPYSSTYLETTSARTLDTVACPPNNPMPEPTGCTAFIVDGGSWDDAPAEGEDSCDSAFLWVEGIPTFSPQSASTWVTIDFYHWDEDPASTMCTNYASYPCVANNLMYEAGLVDEAVTCSSASRDLGDYPKVVQDAVNKTGKYAHALGTIEYTLAPNTGETRTCTITWIADSVQCPSRTFVITQLGNGGGGGDCDCSTFEVRGRGVTVSSAASSSEYTVATYTAATDCSEPFTFSLKTGDNFMGNFRASGGYVYAKCIANNDGNTRQSQYYMNQGDCQGTIYINQQKAYITPTEDVFKWDYSGHDSHYSASTAGNYIDLSQFLSVYNGEYTNAVMSANVSWIVTNSVMYVNNNEMTPNLNNTLYLSDYNYGSSSRTGTLTLTQKGTSNRITVDITQTVKPIDCFTISTAVTLASDEVCKGQSLGFTYSMEDSRCTTPFEFDVYDANFNVQHITATSMTSGSINTSNMAVGAAFLHNPINSRRYNFTVKDCGEPEPQSAWTISVNARNITANETIYVNGFELHMSGGSILTYTQSQKVQLVAGAMSSFTSKTFTGSAQEGETIDTAAMLVSASSSSGSAPQSIQCTVTPTTISDGTTYEIRYNGGLVRLSMLTMEDGESTDEEENTEETE